MADVPQSQEMAYALHGTGSELLIYRSYLQGQVKD